MGNSSKVILKSCRNEFNFVLENFPRNYVDYLERIEYAIMAYHSGNAKLTDDDIFELQKPEFTT